MRHFRTIAGALLIFSGAATELPAQQPAASITGVVRDTAGTPVANATVLLPDRRQSVLTAGNGTFRLDDVLPGRHTLTVRRIGYLPLELRLLVRLDGPNHVELTLLERPVVVETVVVLAPDVGLRGVVHDMGLQPIANAEISSSSSSRRVRTGADGQFAWGSLGPGRHLLRVTAYGFAPRLFAIDIPAGESRQVSVRLDRTNQRPSNMDEIAWTDFGQRRRWASSLVTFLTDEDLQRGSNIRLPDDPRIRQEAGEDACVFVNGRPSVLPLDYFYVDDVAAVEVIPAGATFGHGSRPRSRPSLGRATGGAATSFESRGCRTLVYIWLK